MGPEQSLVDQLQGLPGWDHYFPVCFAATWRLPGGRGTSICRGSDSDIGRDKGHRAGSYTSKAGAELSGCGGGSAETQRRWQGLDRYPVQRIGTAGKYFFTMARTGRGDAL